MMRNPGFTLAELLIALGILGVIATFTIPKVLQAQADTQNLAIAKESLAAVSGAYVAYRQQGGEVTATTSMDDFTAFLNYVRVDTVSPISHKPGSSNGSCSNAVRTCLLLHNGAILWYADGFGAFGGTDPDDDLLFLIDPDGAAGTATGQAVEFFLYVNGRVTSRGAISGDPTRDPTWFNWD